jgi:thiamine biosynthesis lipoprotein
MTTATIESYRTLHVEHCMGTVFTIDVRDPGEWDGTIVEVVAWLHHVDAVFSTYKDDSDISRLGRGELTIEDADPDVGLVLSLCADIEKATNGYFTTFAGTELDPAGLVKGWAIERASQLLRSHGSENHAVNGGGDIQLAGEAGPDRPWTIGISDPLDGTRILATASGLDFAIATSGVAERGQHIIDPHTSVPANGLASVTLTGASLTLVDAYATAAFAMGPRALSFVENVTGIEALLIFPDGTSVCTARFPGQRVSRSEPEAERL